MENENNKIVQKFWIPQVDLQKPLVAPLHEKVRLQAVTQHIKINFEVDIVPLYQ